MYICRKADEMEAKLTHDQLSTAARKHRLTWRSRHKQQSCLRYRPLFKYAVDNAEIHSFLC
jgi:hypothetical protein